MMQSVGDYLYSTTDGFLGSGLFGKVYKGHHKTNPNKIVAVKCLKKMLFTKLIFNEIGILKQLTALNNENVVAIYDFKEERSKIYLIMEYCNGGDLSQYMEIKGKLDENTIRFFLQQLANGMKALSRVGVVHRDLKPKNILVTYKTSSRLRTAMILKISDFGLSRCLQDGEKAHKPVGTPGYMAPEVLQFKSYSAKADMWSLGVIVYQCLTTKKYILSRSIPSGTSRALEDLLLGLLQKDPVKRFDLNALINHNFLTNKY